MKALAWHGANDVRIDNVADPKIEDPGDVIIKVTSTAICGSDLHLLSGMVPTMEAEESYQPVCPTYSQTKYIEKNG